MPAVDFCENENKQIINDASTSTVNLLKLKCSGANLFENCAIIEKYH